MLYFILICHFFLRGYPEVFHLNINTSSFEGFLHTSLPWNVVINAYFSCAAAWGSSSYRRDPVLYFSYHYVRGIFTITHSISALLLLVWFRPNLTWGKILHTTFRGFMVEIPILAISRNELLKLRKRGHFRNNDKLYHICLISGPLGIVFLDISCLMAKNRCSRKSPLGSSYDYRIDLKLAEILSYKTINKLCYFKWPRYPDLISFNKNNT